jgi:hypothetical protein
MSPIILIGHTNIGSYALIVKVILDRYRQKSVSSKSATQMKVII